MRMNDSIAKVRNRSLVGACAAINVTVDGILGAYLFLLFLCARLRFVSMCTFIASHPYSSARGKTYSAKVDVQEASCETA